ncbi:uncharacterized protein LOC118645689 [Monomorium pharaonis]|uniref:uncharacterized protein LOC118645689 n=1 Tax=Monomorium pharaonis TaxID=307658 RepID=UPI00174634E0|nr:uncharacterized protein LOC118645689 [Monomorium pharaonis]
MNNKDVIVLSLVNVKLKESQKLHNVMEQMLKCIKNKDDKCKVPQKPALLPIATVEEMVEFENVNEKTYKEVVSYFHHVGGFTLKEDINLCFKEAVKDCVTVKYTWFGRKEGVHPLYNTRIIMAIYDSVCYNNYFCKPSRAEFQNITREALRSAKQRHRTSIRILRNRQRQPRTARHFWDDAYENEQVNAVESNIAEVENEEES